jgi:PTS system mannose-specific IIB component/fructoselysine and glucoselysine-specific PTS system IIB component
MPVSLVRVDDRLIHGQVVVGWVNALGIKRIVVVDDDVAESEWQQELYTLGTPPDLAVEFVAVANAAPVVERSAKGSEKTLVLVANVPTAARLCDAVPDITALNLGGLHDGTGRSKRLSYVYMSDDEAKELDALCEHGVKVAAQDVPTARPVPLKELL